MNFSDIKSALASQVQINQQVDSRISSLESACLTSADSVNKLAEAQSRDHESLNALISQNKTQDGRLDRLEYRADCSEHMMNAFGTLGTILLFSGRGK